MLFSTFLLFLPVFTFQIYRERIRDVTNFFLRVFPSFPRVSILFFINSFFVRFVCFIYFPWFNFFFEENNIKLLSLQLFYIFSLLFFCIFVVRSFKGKITNFYLIKKLFYALLVWHGK